MQKDIAKSGFFIINKPSGVTSHDVVMAIRKQIGIRKVGHTGTLDPMATGIMITPINSATRLIQFTHTFLKTYEAEITLGASSTTDDAEGEITPQNNLPPNHQAIETALMSFKGTIQQLPPKYAAIKVDGKKLYEYARQGKEVKLTPRPVTIKEIKILSYAYPHLTIEVTVSTGTYIRSLARDLGEKLNTGAYLSKLHRSSIGPWTDKKSIKIEDLSRESYIQHLYPAHELVSHLPHIILENDNVVKLQQGRVVEVNTEIFSETSIAVYNPQKTLIGIGNYTPLTHTLSPKIILTTSIG